MKNIKYIIVIAIFMFCKSWGQNGLPLKQGSIVITHKPEYGLCNANSSTNSTGKVVQILDASNTLNIPTQSNGNRYVWTKNSPPQNPVSKKPLWQADSSWTINNLGRVFGLTLDDSGNIYVANTSIYRGEAVQRDKIFKISGTSISSTITPIIQFSPSSDNSKGIGNIKVFKIGATNFMLASVWEDGKIHLLKENTLGNWSDVAQHSPNFNGRKNNSLPYGVAARPKPGTTGVYEIFFGEYDLSNTGPNTRIFKVELKYVTSLSSWQFDTFTETLLNITGIPVRPANFAQINTSTTYWGTVSSSNSPIPVADISFSSDYKKMVIGEQQLATTQDYQAHNSGVQEFQENSIGSWNAIGKYPSGNLNLIGPSNSGFNAVGGVSYWNNTLYQDSKVKCDETVLFSADAIYCSSCLPIYGVNSEETTSPSNFGGSVSNVYGFQALPSNNTFLTNTDAFNYSLKVDADDNYNLCDKNELGDIEAFNVPVNCCSCGSWNNIKIDGTTYNSVSEIPAVIAGTNSIITPSYSCNGDCSVTYTYGLINGSQNIAIGSGSSLDINTNQYLKNLPCGKEYLIVITPNCGETRCEPVRIRYVVPCPPPCSDCGGNAQVNIIGNPVYNAANGTVSANFSIANGKPVTEIRTLVEEFRVTSSNGNENCILCKNTPKTWGSIQQASLSGISPSFSNSVMVDNREAVFKNGGILSLPGNISITLALPNTTGLSCCSLKAEICVKFVIRDVNCCEKEILKCFSVNL